MSDPFDQDANDSVCPRHPGFEILGGCPECHEETVRERDEARRQLAIADEQRATVSSRLEDVQSELADSRADADALEKLSRGLYERIEGKHEWVVPSACQTALNYIDFLKLQVNDLRKKLSEYEHRGQHMTCGPCEHVRLTEKRPCPSVKATSKAGGFVCDMKQGHDGLHHTVYAGSDQYWSDET